MNSERTPRSASFEEIVERTNQARRTRHLWVHQLIGGLGSAILLILGSLYLAFWAIASAPINMVLDLIAFAIVGYAVIYTAVRSAIR